MKPAYWAILATAITTAAFAQAGPVVTVDYTNPALTPAHWVMTILPDGSGHFHSERGDAPPDPTQGFEAANIDRDIQVGPAFAAHAFATARQRRLFSVPCESHMKVAFQGSKSLSYTGPDGSGSCTFNFSKDKEIQNLGDALVAVAAAIVEGARLETLLQHDRLGLDKETEFLVEAVGDGRVQQICTIQRILHTLAEDPQVMDRVRKRAKLLLARTQG
jgi:hypothetical protein